MTMTIPKHLSTESRRTYRRIATEYDLTPDAESLLRVALENFDMAQQARALVASEGLITATGKRHPALDVANNCYGVYLRAVRQLGLDVMPPGNVGRPSTSV